MKTPSPKFLKNTSRREFLVDSGKAIAGTALAGALATARAGYAAENNTIKVALVGCGGRGTGAAANALSTQGPVRLWALADVFADALESSRQSLMVNHGAQVHVPPERQFVGFDGYQHAMDSLNKGDVVILATPPAFRPVHFDYAVQKGLNVFMEKSFAVDAPGIRRLLKSNEIAKEKNLKVATGLMSRHCAPLEEAIQRVHDGAIGEVISCMAFRMHGPVGLREREPDMKELEYQIRNYSGFTWLNGSFIVDWLIHNIDVCCWVKNAWPESAHGMGGRQARTAKDQLFDHYEAQFTFPDGTLLHAQGRHIAGCHDFFGDVIHGATGSAVLGEGVSKPRLFKGHKARHDQILWGYDGPPFDAYQREHDLLFHAIRNDQPCNEVERSAKSCFTAILGRMAVESGKAIGWTEAFNSGLELAPGLENIQSLNDPAPVRPDAGGRYPIAMPGHTRVL